MRRTALLLATAALAAGCQSQPGSDRPLSLDDRPLVHPNGQRRSLAFDSPYHRTLAVSADHADLYDWWADRNDARRAALSGYELPTYLYAHTRTVDRQTDFGGEPRNYSNHTTYRGRVIQGIR